MLSGTIILAAALAGAQGEPAKPPKSQEAAICKTRAQTGSRFATKTCRTAAQWEKMAEQNRRDMEETANRPFIPDCRMSGNC